MDSSSLQLEHPLHQVLHIKPPQPPLLSQSKIILPSLKPVKFSADQRLKKARDNGQSKKGSSSSTKITEPRSLATYFEPSERKASGPQIASLEPLLQAVLAENGKYNLASLDLITTRSTLQKLFEQASPSKPNDDTPPASDVKLYIELIQTPTSSSQKTIAEVAGSVLMYPEGDPFTGESEADYESEEGFLVQHNLIRDDDEGSKKAVGYQFGGMRCLVGYNCETKAQISQGVAESSEKGVQLLVKKKKTRTDDPEQGFPSLLHHGNHKVTHTTVTGVAEDEKIEVDDDDAEAPTEFEHAKRLEELQQIMEHVGLHSVPTTASVKTKDDEEFAKYSRQRADSASSVSSLQSQNSLRSIASTHTAFSSAPGDGNKSDHDDELPSSKSATTNITSTTHMTSPKLPLLFTQTVSSSLPLRPKAFFDTPVSQMQFHSDSSAPSLLDLCALSGAESEVAQFKSTLRYSATAAAWEKEHYEALKALIVVLRKIRSTVAKAGGRCKVVVERGGKVRSFRVKEGPRSVLSEAVLAGWR